MTPPKNPILDQFPLFCFFVSSPSPSSINFELKVTVSSLAVAMWRNFFTKKKGAGKMLQLWGLTADKPEVTKICYCIWKKPCPCWVKGTVRRDFNSVF
jgi:hypothetical protein